MLLLPKPPPVLLPPVVLLLPLEGIWPVMVLFELLPELLPELLGSVLPLPLLVVPVLPVLGLTMVELPEPEPELGAVPPDCAKTKPAKLTTPMAAKVAVRKRDACIRSSPRVEVRTQRAPEGTGVGCMVAWLRQMVCTFAYCLAHA